MLLVWGADAVKTCGRQHRRHRYREESASPARSETLCTHGNSLHGTREVRWLAVEIVYGPRCESERSTTAMDDHRKSDSPIVPKKPPNNAGQLVAEAVEGRGLAKGNSVQQTRSRTQGRIRLQHALDRIREAARRDKGPIPYPTERLVVHTRGRSPVR